MQQIPCHRTSKTKNVMEIFMSLQDSFVVFLMYLTGNFHLQFNNDIKIVVVCIYICLYFCRTIMISSMFLDLACRSIVVIHICPGLARTLTRWCLPQSYHRFCNSYCALDLMRTVVVHAELAA